MTRCRLWPVWLLLPLLVSCSVNPVTGEKELTLIGEQQELAIGDKNYGPYRQAQGGDYVADPALTAYVQKVGARLAAVADRKLPYEFRVVNDDTPNAWALPGGKIAVNRGLLLQLDNEAQLAAVLAHEIVHAAARHSAQSMQRGIFLQGALVAAGVALGDSQYRELGMLGSSIGANLVKSRYSRDAEREADTYGMRYMVRAGYDPAEAVALQRTFLKLSEDKRQDWLSGLFASHPPSAERVANNGHELEILHAPGGELGRDPYRRATAHLRRTEPAYQAYAQALQALQKDELDKAAALLDKAIGIEPKEALFHVARAGLEQRRGHKESAARDYDRAVALNPEYFLPRLKRGLFLRDRGEREAAQRDLKASVERLPTADGYFGLGQVAQAAGNRELAVAYFGQASQSESEVGRQAAQQLATLDLPAHPDRYIQATLLLRKDGQLLLRLKNTTALPVSGLRVAIGRQVGVVFRQSVVLNLRGTLGAGETRTLDTVVGPIDAAEARGLAARVLQASPAGAM